MSRSTRLWVPIAALAPLVWVAFWNVGDRLGVGAVTFSPDGRALASVRYPQHPRPHAQSRVWDLTTGRERQSEHPDRVGSRGRAYELRRALVSNPDSWCAPFPGPDESRPKRFDASSTDSA